MKNDIKISSNKEMIPIKIKTMMAAPRFQKKDNILICHMARQVFRY